MSKDMPDRMPKKMSILYITFFNIQSDLLAFILTVLAFHLAFYLTTDVAFFLTFDLAFFQTPYISGILSGMLSRILSGFLSDIYHLSYIYIHRFVYFDFFLAFCMIFGSGRSWLLQTGQEVGNDVMARKAASESSQ
jgi:hypothetical protein